MPTRADFSPLIRTSKKNTGRPSQMEKLQGFGGNMSPGRSDFESLHSDSKTLFWDCRTRKLLNTGFQNQSFGKGIHFRAFFYLWWLGSLLCSFPGVAQEAKPSEGPPGQW